MPIKSEGYDDGEGLACRLTFTYTSKYPDELPVIEIDNEDNFDEVISTDSLLEYLMEQVIKLLLSALLGSYQHKLSCKGG